MAEVANKWLSRPFVHHDAKVCMQEGMRRNMGAADGVINGAMGPAVGF